MRRRRRPRERSRQDLGRRGDRGGDLRRGPPVPARRRAKIAAARASPSPTAAVGPRQDAGVCWLKGRWAGEPGRTRAARERTCGPAGTRARARLRERQRSSRSRSGESGGRRRHLGGRGIGSRGGGSAARAEELRRERERDAAEGLARRKAPPLAAGGRIGGHLLILVPTVARPGVDYLTRTVDSALAEARRGEHGFDRVTVRVVSHSSAQEHAAFRKIRDRPAGPEDMAAKVSLEAAVDADRRRTDPGAGRAAAVDDRNNPDDVPGPRVRQQTPDLVSVLRDVGGVGGGGGADYLLLTEDDATMCEGHLAGIGRRMAAAAALDPMWTMLRTSIGFIGIVMHRADSNALANFLEMHYQRKPPDILLIEWCGNLGGRGARTALAQGRAPRSRREGPDAANGVQVRGEAPLARRHFVSLKNSFLHIGEVSSLRSTHAAVTPECDAPLTSFLWALERFKDTARCGRWDRAVRAFGAA